MALINWQPSMSVNVAVIDQQHQKLVNMINSLNDAMVQGKGRDIQGQIINGLVTYAATHFSTEEKLFLQHGYPDTMAHVAEHNAFVSKVSEFRNQFQSGRMSLTIELMSFLSKWLNDHILLSDRKYSGFFKEKGVS